ncbi:cerebellar degeneration-related protein 2-like isoform X2 [Nematostella vectensis]|uniref:cerebellar degeneration-related protein 2-like isoform X2 n=1 Tax=Nematostella vectensis TaxID=45351 RepID=UPI0013904268|nr:cerebellar degeneration-related protein 2-like isoform X2 [Nematostella vectensis]
MDNDITHLVGKCSHCDNRWNIFDLELAAEIGKNLLERNKELEILLKSSHQFSEEQALKNEFLSKQLETLREVNENRLKAFEQMEMTAMELQKANMKLQNETSSMKKRYKDLAEMVENLDTKCEDYRVEIEELQRERTRLQKELSVALAIKLEEQTEEKETSDENARRSSVKDEDTDEKERELELLNEKISNLKVQHSVETRKREELEYELSELIRENQHLESQLREFAKQAEEWRLAASEASLPERAIDILLDGGEDHNASRDDEPEDDSFVVVEDEELSRQTSLASDHSAVVVLSPSEERLSVMRDHSTSFFSELDNQYHELVRKYDALLDKCKYGGLGTGSAIPMVQRAVQVSPMCDQPPSTFDNNAKTSHGFKKMFKDIYNKIEDTKNFRPSRPGTPEGKLLQG